MAKRTTRRAVPTFASERAEREYWETHDAGDVVDWASARQAVFPNLKASTETISLRLPSALLSDLKVLANKRDVPYQSLLKVYLADRVSRETIGMRRPDKALRPTSRAAKAGATTRRARAARG
jgi:predicted DNA binding CopG/RHH family protein